jgi:hypothetical protein
VERFAVGVGDHVPAGDAVNLPLDAVTEALFDLAAFAFMILACMAPVPRGHRCHRRDDQ